MKNFKPIISISFIAVFAFSLALNFAFAEPKKVRVFTQDSEEAAQAVDAGCDLKKQSKKVIVLVCPDGVALSLGLSEDVQVFVQGQGRGEDQEFLIKDTNANKQIGANLVHVAGNTGVGRKVVILDTGYNYLHPELSSSFSGGKDFVNKDNDPMDDNGHGSHVAGLVTGDGVNTGAKGIAPDTTIIAGKVLDQNGSGYFSDIISGIYWAVDGTDGIYGTADDFGADAISMSLGTSQPYTYKGFCDNVFPALTTAVKYAVDKGVLVVVAAGNSGGAGVSLPGCISYSTTVGAVDSLDKIASFSGRGNAVDISAPGVSLLSAWLGSSYVYASGTSMATPVVSGVIALIKAAHPLYSLLQVQAALFTSAKDLGKFGKDTSYGWGRVNALGAVSY